MEFGSDSRWMMPMADPAAFEMSPLERAERAAAVHAARRLDAMIRLLCPEPANEPGGPVAGCGRRAA